MADRFRVRVGALANKRLASPRTRRSSVCHVRVIAARHVVSVALVSAGLPAKQLKRRGSTLRPCDLLLGAAAFSMLLRSRNTLAHGHRQRESTQVLNTYCCYAARGGCFLRLTLNSCVHRLCLHQAESVSSNIDDDDAFYRYTSDGMSTPCGYALY